MAANLVVGDSDCGFNAVVNALKNAPAFEDDLEDNIMLLATDLELTQATAKDIIRKLQQRHANFTPLEFLLTDVLMKWRSLKSNSALLSVLICVLRKRNLNDMANELENAFAKQKPVETKPAETKPDANQPARDTTDFQIEVDFEKEIEANKYDNLLRVDVKRSEVTGIKKDAPDPKSSYAIPKGNTGKGYVLIINIISFSDVNVRKGAHHDTDNLKQLYTQLGFTVFAIPETILKTKVDVQQVLQKFAEKCTNDRVASMMIFVGSHGQQQQIFLLDGTLLDLYDDVIYRFNSKEYPELDSIPKIFIVQACRSRNIARDSLGFKNIDNTLVIYSTLPHNPAYRDVNKGSFYVTCLVKVFQENACSKELRKLVDDISRMLAKQDVVDEGIPVKVQGSYEVLGSFKEFYFNF